MTSRRDWFAAQFVLAAAVAALAWLLWGYSFGILTNEYHATLVLKSAGLARFQGDQLARGISGYASPLWWVAGVLVHYVRIQHIFFLGFLVSRFLFAWALGSAAAAAIGDDDSRTRRAAWILGATASLSSGFLIPLPVGGDPVLGPYFSQTFLSVALLILASSLAARGMLLRSAILLGVAMDCNIMQSVFGTAIIGLQWIIPPSNRPRNGTTRTIWAISLCAAVASPALVLAIRAIVGSHGTQAWAGEQLSSWARFWLEGHFFADGRSAGRLVDMAALLATPFLLELFRSRQDLRRFLPLPATLVPASLALAELALIGHFPCRLLFQLHLFRSDVLAYAISCAAAVSLVVQGWRRPEIGIPSLAISALLLGGYHLHAALLALALLASTTSVGRRQPASIALVLVLMLHAATSALHGMRMASFVELCGAAGFLAALRTGKWPSLVLRFAVAAFFLQLTISFWNRDWKNTNYAKIHGEDSRVARDLERIGQSSSPDAVFILPPSVNARPFLRRGVWFNFDDGATFLWDKGAEIEVARRMKLMGIAYRPGARVDPDSLDAQWYSGLCGFLPNVEKEGVTRIILPDPKDRNKPWVALSPSESKIALKCPEPPTNSASDPTRSQPSSPH